MSAARLTGASLGLLLLSLAAASPQSAEPTPTAPAEPSLPLTQQCTTTDTSSFRGEGKTLRYVFEVQNICEKRLKCALNVFIINPFGPVPGHKVIVLAPQSKGAASRGSLVMKVKNAGGFLTQTHSCKEI